jgi:hypothetical protein
MFLLSTFFCLLYILVNYRPAVPGEARRRTLQGLIERVLGEPLVLIPLHARRVALDSAVKHQRE